MSSRSATSTWRSTPSAGSGPQELDRGTYGRQFALDVRAVVRTPVTISPS